MINVKQAIIGVGVFIVFIIYSAGLRHQKPILIKPSTLASSTTSTSNGSSTTGSSTGAASGSNTTTNNSSGAASSTPPSTASNPSSTGKYRDGTYTGNVADAYYGNVKVSVTISGGKITGVKFLQYPNTHSTSVYINQQAMPYLTQEAIQAQSSNVQIISGATFTSQAFIQSLSSALAKA